MTIPSFFDFLVSFFLSFFLSFYVLTVGVVGYCCTLSQLRHTTLGRTPLDDRSARRRDLYLTTHNTHIHAPSRSRTRNSSMRAATDPLLRPRGHWDRPFCNFIALKVQTPIQRHCLWWYDEGVGQVKHCATRTFIGAVSGLHCI
jgi:hypothetical protein